MLVGKLKGGHPSGQPQQEVVGPALDEQGRPLYREDGKPILASSDSLLQDRFLNTCRRRASGALSENSARAPLRFGVYKSEKEPQKALLLQKKGAAAGASAARRSNPLSNQPEPRSCVSLRGIDDPTYTLELPERELGQLSNSQLMREACPEAIYLHQGKSYLVRKIRRLVQNLLLLFGQRRHWGIGGNLRSLS